jgi:hypothetical protein
MFSINYSLEKLLGSNPWILLAPETDANIELIPV